MLTLTLREPTTLPLELTGLVPTALAGKSPDELARLEIWFGNQKETLADLFSFDGATDDGQLTLVGDFSAANGIGAGMEAGVLRVDGNAGNRVGHAMHGGTIEVTGDVGHHLGAEMHGGVIKISGSACNNVGGPIAGSERGMAGGTILVSGNVGSSIGQRMRRGMIAVAGTAGDYVGHGMLAGTIVVMGGCGKYPGCEMSRGTICLSNNDVLLSPTFRYACSATMPMLNMVGRHLDTLGFDNDIWTSGGRWIQYNGDFLVSGRGEVFLAE